MADPKIKRTPPDTPLVQFTDRYYDSWGSTPPTPAELYKRKYGSIDEDIDLPAPKSVPKKSPSLEGLKRAGKK